MHGLRSWILVLLVASVFVSSSSAHADELGRSIRATLSSDTRNQYFFRGLLQVDDPPVLQADSHIDVALYDTEEVRFYVPVDFMLMLTPNYVWSHDAQHKGPGAWYESRLGGGAGLRLGQLTAEATGVVYSSPAGLFDEIYELSLIGAYDDTNVWRHGQRVGFTGIYPRLKLAIEVDGARDGGDPGAYGEFALSPRAHILESPTLAVDFVLPVCVGFSVSKYYELPKVGGQVIDERPGFVQIGPWFEVEARFVPRRLGIITVSGGAEILLPVAAREARMSGVDEMEWLLTGRTAARF